MVFHNDRIRIRPARYGWHAIACVLVAKDSAELILGAYSSLSTTAKGLMQMGAILPFLITMQAIAATIVALQAFNLSARAHRFAFVPWILLAFVSLAWFSGSLITREDPWFQSLLFAASIAVFSWGAINAGRTE